MGNLTAKVSGEIASFKSPTKANIKSLKVHFNPKQSGSGDPSPENVREIEGWDGVDGYNDPKYGGFIVWNQCYDLSTLKIGSGTSDAFNVIKLDTGFRVTANANISVTGSKVIYFTIKWNKIQNHRYIFLCKIKSNTLKFSSFYIYHANGSSNRPVQNSTGQYVMTETYTGTTSDSNSSLRLYIYGIELLEGESFEVTDLMAIDLDMMFGASVIDANATTTTELINWFTSIITNYDYREYNEGEVTTVSAVNNEPYTNLSIDWSSDIGTVYGGYIDLINGELVQDMAYGQVTSEWLSSRESGYIGYTSSITALDGASGVWVRNAFNSTARERKSGGIKANCNAFKVLMNSTGVSSSQNRTAFAVDNESITSVADFISAVEILEQNDNGLYLAYELAEPITHQLTPTQLNSFVGQNNFWSNADYVEIEYDLIETIDIQKAKQKIILNQPQLKTVSNKIVSFNTDMVAPLKNCKIYFNPIQLGTGDAFYTNVKNINGWTSIDSYVNGDKISVDWTNDAGTIYGGYLDLAKNEVVAEWIKYVFNRSSTVSTSGTSTLVEGLTWMTLRKTITSTPPYMATPNNGDSYGFFTIGDWRKAAVGGKNRAFVNSKNLDVVLVSINGEDLTTSEGRNTFFNYIENNEIPIECVYKLATPIHYPLTTQQLLTIKSTNYIWSETNGQQIDVKYWTHKNLTPTPLTNHLENQTWTDSAYISSSGKKTTGGTSASHFLTNQILLEAGTYVLSGFSHYVGTDNTNFRIHAYDSTGNWLRQITFQQIGNLSPVDISFTLDTDTYVNVSIAMDFDGVLAKIN